MNKFLNLEWNFKMLPCTGLVRWYIPFLMQIVPISIRFRQNVLQFSNDPGKIPKIFKRTQNNHENFQQRFSNIKKCKIERGFVRLPKMNSKFPNTHVYDCNSKWRWNFRRWLKMRGWKFPSSFANHTKSWRPFSTRQSFNGDGKFCRQCYTNAENVNALFKIIFQTGCQQ